MADFVSWAPVQNNPDLIFYSGVFPIVLNEINSNANNNNNNNTDNNIQECITWMPIDPILEISVECILYHQYRDNEIKKIIKGIQNINKTFNRYLICSATNLV